MLQEGKSGLTGQVAKSPQSFGGEGEGLSGLLLELWVDEGSFRGVVGLQWLGGLKIALY